MPLTTDELLAALPDVGLRLVTLGEHRGAARWAAMLAPADYDERDVWCGDDDTPVIAALADAGVNIEDEAPF